MSTSKLKSNPAHQEHLLRNERLVMEFSIVGNATPASKQHVAEVPSLCVLRSEGKTAEADAVETITWTAPVDNSSGNSVFGILLNLGDNKADKVYSVSLSELTNVSASEALTGPNGSASYLTSAGNIAIEVAATGLNLASESPTFQLVVEYREAL